MDVKGRFLHWLFLQPFLPFSRHPRPWKRVWAVVTAAGAVVCVGFAAEPFLRVYPWTHAPSVDPLALVLCFAAYAAVALALLPFALYKKSLYLCVPALLVGAALLASARLPVFRWGVAYNFSVTGAQRRQVVDMVESGRLRPGGGFYTDMPPGLPFLSDREALSVEIAGQRTIVYFMTVPVFIDNHGGFMYRSDGSEPRGSDLGGDVVGFFPVAPRWWWVSFT